MSNPSPNRNSELRATAYDRVSSWLVSLLVMTSVLVAALLMVYFAQRLPSGEVAVPAQPVSLSGGGGGGEGGEEGEVPLPDITEEAEPQLEDTLDTIATAVDQTEPVLFNTELDAPPPVEQDYIDTRKPGTTGSGGGRGTGIGTGTGSGRGPGSGGGSGGGMYRGEPQREIHFEPRDLLEYARYLDFFKIELGVLGRDNKVYYAYNLSQETPSVREGKPDDELRLYMNSALGRFAALDRRLAQRAKITDRGKIILQFYPDETAAILYGLERTRAQAANRRPEQIFRTVFRVTRKGKAYEFSVEDQKYR